MSNWNTDLEAAKTQGRVLLCVNVYGRQMAVIGSFGSVYDPGWFEFEGLAPDGTVPLGWMPLPDPMPAT